MRGKVARMSRERHPGFSPIPVYRISGCTHRPQGCGQDLFLRRVFPKEALEVRLHGVRQRDRIAHVVDRAIEAETHQACEFGLAVRLGQQQHAFGRTHARFEGAKRVAGCVEHPERRTQLSDLLRELPAVHGPGHDDVGEQEIERDAGIHQYQRLGRIGRGENLVAKAFETAGDMRPHDIVILSTHRMVSDPPRNSGKVSLGGNASEASTSAFGR